MAAELLLDTGPLVALLDVSQKDHRRCVEFYAGWRGAVITTEPVITEATHLLQHAEDGAERCLAFVLEGGILISQTGIERLQRVKRLMRKYRDLPMDYADGTLVALAEELGTEDVLTLDRRDFSVFRCGRRRPFKIHP